MGSLAISNGVSVGSIVKWVKHGVVLDGRQLVVVRLGSFGNCRSRGTTSTHGAESVSMVAMSNLRY